MLEITEEYLSRSATMAAGTPTMVSVGPASQVGADEIAAFLADTPGVVSRSEGQLTISYLTAAGITNRIITLSGQPAELDVAAAAVPRRNAA